MAIVPPPEPPPTGRTPAAPSPTTAPRRNLAMPLPLSAPQEAEVRDIYHRRVRAKCAEEIQQFAACCTGRSFSIAWRCRPQKKIMDSCMVKAATEEEKDAARTEWYAGAPERKRKKEDEKRVAKVHEKFHQEYWGEFNKVKNDRKS